VYPDDIKYKKAKEDNDLVKLKYPQPLVVVPGGRLDLSKVGPVATPLEFCLEMDAMHE
jgi:hypothetical protein